VARAPHGLPFHVAEVAVGAIGPPGLPATVVDVYTPTTNNAPLAEVSRPFATNLLTTFSG
jgi:hypothetical protein